MSENKEIELKKSEQYDEEFFDKYKDYLDYMSSNEMMLRKNRDLFNDDTSLLLYKLPLTEVQRKNLHKKIIKDLKKNNLD